MITLVLYISQVNANVLKYAGELKAFMSERNQIILIDACENSIEELSSSISADIIYIREINKCMIELYNDVIWGIDKTKNDILIVDENMSFKAQFYKEMHSVLYYTDKHTIVSPRTDITGEALVAAVRKYLPRFSVVPAPVNKCVMIKRNVIDIVGCFRKEYASFEYAVKDFSQKANGFGYSSIIANHAILHAECMTIDVKCENLEDKTLFSSNYDYYERVENHYALNDIHPSNVFLDMLAEGVYEKKKILFNYMIMHPIHNGTSEYQLELLSSFYKLFKDKYDIYILTNHEANYFFGLSRKYPNVLFPETIKDTFHLGFCANQPFSMNIQYLFNRHCLKAVYNILDIIALRCNHLRKENLQFNDIFRLGFKLSDGIITISEYSKNDCLAYFSDNFEIRNKPFKKIYLASNFGNAEPRFFDLPFEHYFLIIGNAFKHKALSETIEALSGSVHNYIIVGYGNNDYIMPNIYGYKSGQLEEDFLSFIYAKCRAIIFPSLYEGFGLPVVIGLKYKKKIVLKSNELNIELSNHLSQFKDSFLFFDSFEEIKDIIHNIDDTILANGVYEYNWENVAAETEKFFDEIINTEVDIHRLTERWHLFNYLSMQIVSAEAVRNEDAAKYLLKSYVMKLSPRLYVFIKKIYNSIFKSPSPLDAKYNVFSDKIDIYTMSLSDSIHSSLDVVQTLLINGEQVINLQGWAFNELFSTEDAELYIVLKKNNRAITFNSLKLYRPDVVNAYSGEISVSLYGAGFIVNIRRSALPFGKYEVGFCIKSGGEYTYKDANNLKLKVGLLKVDIIRN